MVPPERVDVPVVEAPGAQAEHEAERSTALEEPRQKLRPRRPALVRPVRRHDDVAELGREPFPGEVERLEAARIRVLHELLLALPARRRYAHPSDDLARCPGILLVPETDGREGRDE